MRDTVFLRQAELLLRILPYQYLKRHDGGEKLLFAKKLIL